MPNFITKFERGQPERGGKTRHFLALNVNIPKTVADTVKVTIND